MNKEKLYNSSSNIKDGFFYKALTSSNPVKKALGESLVNLAKLSGMEKKVKKQKEKEEKYEKDELSKFFKSEDVEKKLNNINIDSKQFMVTVNNVYPFNSKPSKLPLLISSFGKLVKQAKDKKINTKQLSNIVERMLNVNFQLRDNDFLSMDDIKSPNIRSSIRSSKIKSKSKSRSSSNIKRSSKNKELKSRSRSSSNIKRLSKNKKSKSRSSSNIKKSFEDDLASKSTLDFSEEDLPKLKINKEMKMGSLPNIADLSPFSFSPSELQQKGTSRKSLISKKVIEKVTKKRSVKQSSVSKKVIKKRSIKKRSVPKKRSVKQSSVSKKVIKKRSIKKVTKKRSVVKKVPKKTLIKRKLILKKTKKRS